MLNRRVLIGGMLVSLFAPAISYAKSTYYLYDNLGRVCGVIYANGSTAYYNYDAVGNQIAEGGADKVTNDGFDPTFYKVYYKDIYYSGVNPYEHYNSNGWHENRRASAYFDTLWYLSTYSDVSNAGINPLMHYNNNGWREGRDPSPFFSTRGYLQNYPDVAAANINPYVHFLQHGLYEGRMPFGSQQYNI